MERFKELVRLIRQEYWLHGCAPEDFNFVANPATMTIRARAHRLSGETCELIVTEEMLRGDLEALAREFFKNRCGGASAISGSHRIPRR